MDKPKNAVTAAAEVRQIAGDILPTQAEKVLNHIDPLRWTWIECIPFCVFATRNRIS